ncbi:hypothetical protein GUITHDRAFT_105747 [Guillardia theta CCMP2712]|uniref:J domain-containing protein n=1 Tax=Guillardia theta (strain CCMP2712) TaxID=905079 RepID=L1JJU4_GUITC|nr:hypothetical protein GUITHDRAFT_105747 [Guillardia theta CCMP2712]EKX48602.1 hypothetical protein GUITHDRAFT_105747 [Guillardia theta CCMP2712]|eukprot:XP_005835582.1 hypothetical protein GUITHDRAFT_105747 [Guillardia theta CCMP2712]
MKSLNDMDAGSERNERVDAWEQHVSKRFGRKYWFNKAPRQEDENPRKKARTSSDEAKEEMARNQSLDRESTVNEESSWLLPSTELFEQLNHYQKKLRGEGITETNQTGVWKLHFSRSRGQHFWFNKVTGEARWNHPNETFSSPLANSSELLNGTEAEAEQDTEVGIGSLGRAKSSRKTQGSSQGRELERGSRDMAWGFRAEAAWQMRMREVMEAKARAGDAQGCKFEPLSKVFEEALGNLKQESERPEVHLRERARAAMEAFNPIRDAQYGAFIGPELGPTFMRRVSSTAPIAEGAKIYFDSDHKEFEKYKEKAKAIAKLNGGFFHRTKSHQFLTSLSDLETQQVQEPKINWCPKCAKEEKFNKVDEFGHHIDASWADFFERIQSDDFNLEDFWKDEETDFKPFPKPSSDQQMPKPAMHQNEEDVKNLSPVEEVERIMQVLKDKSDIPIHSFTASELCLLLGIKVSKMNDPDLLRKRYRRLVLILHPDKNRHESAKDAFTAVQQGFENLASILMRRK